MRESPAWLRPAAMLPILLGALCVSVAGGWADDVARGPVGDDLVVAPASPETASPQTEPAASTLADPVPAGEDRPPTEETDGPETPAPPGGDRSGAGGISYPALLASWTATPTDSAGASPPPRGAVARTAAVESSTPTSPVRCGALVKTPQRSPGRICAAATPPRGPPSCTTLPRA